MLQPLQLEGVAARHGRELAELRDFFEKAGCAVGGPGSLHGVAERVQRDRGFHRDLTSHLWVVIHTGKGEISYADLLGLLALAVAGPRFAAEADESDAHALLRFVMDARRELGGDAPRSEAAASPVAAYASVAAASSVAAVTPVVAAAPVIAATPAVAAAAQPDAVVRRAAAGDEAVLAAQARTVSLGRASRSEEEEETGGSRRRWLWVAACLLLAAAVGVGLHYHAVQTHAVPTAPQPAVVPSAAPAAVAPAPVVSEESAAPSAAESASAAAAPTVSDERIAHAPARNGRKPTPVTPMAAARAVTPAAATAATATPRPAPAIAPTAPAAASVAAPPAARPAPPAAVAPKTAAAPAPRLVTPANPSVAAPADFSNTMREHYTPKLLHRTPQEQQELIAETRPEEAAAAARTSTAAAVHPLLGTVEANAVGVHAANVLYSPLPEYPPAAATAHVQGEVKLQTEVNRDGNITSVRVISGPPLLRTAALDAAQRWRYSPDKVGNQSLPISAITVFEFKLP